MSELEGHSTAAFERLCAHYEREQRRQGEQNEVLRQRIERPVRGECDLAAAVRAARRTSERLGPGLQDARRDIVRAEEVMRRRGAGAGSGARVADRNKQSAHLRRSRTPHQSSGPCPAIDGPKVVLQPGRSTSAAGHEAGQVARQPEPQRTGTRATDHYGIGATFARARDSANPPGPEVVSPKVVSTLNTHHRLRPAGRTGTPTSGVPQTRMIG